jgi:hypothetical protein
MVEAVNGLSSPGIKNEETYDEKVGNECLLCHNLKQELEIALQELSSARKIIQILRDDVNKIPDHRTVIQEKHQVDMVNIQSDNTQYNRRQSDSEVVDSRLRIQKSGIANIKGNKIRTVVNGKIVKDEVRTHAGLEDKLINISRNKHRKCTHNVLISGDSHLKSISENIDQFVNTKVSVCSFIKPGASIVCMYLLSILQFHTRHIPPDIQLFV